jgi:hypothetical protein
MVSSHSISTNATNATIKNYEDVKITALYDATFEYSIQSCRPINTCCRPLQDYGSCWISPKAQSEVLLRLAFVVQSSALPLPPPVPLAVQVLDRV